MVKRRGRLPLHKFGVSPSGGKARGADANRFNDSAGSQLLCGSVRVENKCGFVVVRFDAADVVRCGRVQSLHEKAQRLPELGSDRHLVLFLTP